MAAIQESAARQKSGASVDSSVPRTMSPGREMLKAMTAPRRPRSPKRQPSQLSHKSTLKMLRERDGPVEGLLQKLVMPDKSNIRRIFNSFLFLCLVYTGTALPYRLAFIEFAIPTSLLKDDGWTSCELVIDVFFWLDLILCFFFSYRDERNREVVDLRQIGSRYLRSFFFVNLVACIPPKLVGYLIALLDPLATAEERADHSSVHKTMRISRLQRMSRLARLVRMARISKLVSFCMDSSIMSYLKTLRGIRIMNFMCGLLWVVHLIACFWYLCAAMHKDPDHTWVGVTGGGDGVSLLEKGPAEQWLYACYFVLTVFTTVGFGDISANTVGEMVVLMIIMMIGAVINGIILSEVINIITMSDMEAKEICEQKELIKGFAEHTDLHPKVKKSLTDWVSASRSRVHGYNRDQMRDIIVGVGLPRNLTGTLPQAIFNGKLVQNRLITLSSTPGRFCIPIPHRFPLLLALAINPRHFDADEVVYHSWDHAWNIFIILSGIFAAVAQPRRGGGLLQPEPAHGSVSANHGDASTAVAELQNDEVAATTSEFEDLTTAVPYRFFCFGNYFGDVELLLPGHRSRRFTVRCEAQLDDNKLSTVLILHKKDLTQLAHEFPQAWRVWRCIALSREVQRMQKNESFISAGADYHHVAAAFIQRFWRQKRLSSDDPDDDDDDDDDMALERRISTSCHNTYFKQGSSSLTPHFNRPDASDKQQSKRKQEQSLRELGEEMQVVKEELKEVRSDVAQINSKMDAILSALQHNDKERRAVFFKPDIRNL